MKYVNHRSSDSNRNLSSTRGPLGIMKMRSTYKRNLTKLKHFRLDLVLL